MSELTVRYNERCVRTVHSIINMIWSSSSFYVPNVFSSNAVLSINVYVLSKDVFKLLDGKYLENIIVV